LYGDSRYDNSISFPFHPVISSWEVLRTALV
jgi:hypothetical protein